MTRASFVSSDYAKSTVKRIPRANRELASEPILSAASKIVIVNSHSHKLADDPCR